MSSSSSMQNQPTQNSSANEPLIRNISDTARWVAVYRARETERPDALFKDPFARKLAGERGEEIARSMPFAERYAWPYVARTINFDRIINEQIRQGADMVINLAAGLDARPYRMELPSQLQWVEVDLAPLTDYKEEILAGETPAASCAACVWISLIGPSVRNCFVNWARSQRKRSLSRKVCSSI